MDFDNLVREIQEFKGVTRKSSIDNVISLLKESYNVSGDVVIDIGDDASAIDIGNNQVMLIAADGIWGDIMNVNPYWAGYCSVLVNVNDIAAMGGKPLAMVNIMSISNDDIYEDLLKGIKDGCLKFGVPMVGGHLHPDGDVDSLGVAIVGIAQKDKIITSFGAEVGDKIIVAIDLDGKPHEMFSLNWDTTYDKDAQLVRDQITAVQYLAENDYIKSGKDISIISNPERTFPILEYWELWKCFWKLPEKEPSLIWRTFRKMKVWNGLTGLGHILDPVLCLQLHRNTANISRSICQDFQLRRKLLVKSQTQIAFI